METSVYLNGEFVTESDAHISPFDRGFNSGDGVYEVIRVYNGRLFKIEAHLNRLLHGLYELRIPAIDVELLKTIANRLLINNSLTDSDALIYVQVTRGVVQRYKLPSPEIQPTVFMCVSTCPVWLDEQRQGVSVIIVPDIRGTRCDIKSTSLLPNILARNQATQSGAVEALFVRDDVVLEGTHSNFFAVYRDQVITAPLSQFVLSGITRHVVLELCASLGIPIYQNPIYATQLRHFQEMMIVSTSLEITPVVRIGDMAVNAGKVGSITRKLQETFKLHI
jgi:D-alanine transaminase